MTIKEMTELLEIVFQICAELKIPTEEDLIWITHIKKVGGKLKTTKN
jgi:hypothetical protein